MIYLEILFDWSKNDKLKSLMKKMYILAYDDISNQLRESIHKDVELLNQLSLQGCIIPIIPNLLLNNSIPI
ncbi:hypothetical protein FZC35_02360 [Candidatus Cytomitobacter indipagum]|uniref:Uncharacterized protein n=1 Tax=Candidatus Cytomitobacter indipagum TaxID=2601575 RepID=A0A5C0UDV9_9PROT|nr:hypothetical protein [Candidatus Cytomitobacter indipagum]QEK38198.1 hypothetical protein FZC35_02360 [Candidatus Cytomitobacter indipagum]